MVLFNNNNNNNITIITLFLLLINLIIVQSSILIQDISPKDTPYQIYTSSSKCYFSFQFLCSSDGSEACGNQLIISPNIPSTLKISNDTSSIFTIDISSSIGQFTYDLYSGGYSLKIECIELDLDIVSFKLKNGISRYSGLDQNNYLIGVYELQGVKISSNALVSIVPDSISFPNCAFLHLCSNDFSLKCSSINLDVSNINLFSNVNMTIKTSSKSKSFILEPLIKENYNSITDIKYYPSLEYLTNLTLFGIDESPLISFTVNNTYSNIYYSYLLDSNNYYYYPIQGNDSSTTFILPIDRINKINSNFQLSIQNGNKFKSIINISNINIIQYNSFKSLQIPKDIEYRALKTTVYNTRVSLLNVLFTNNVLNSLTPIEINFGDNTFIKSMSFPYGYVNGVASNYSFSIANSVLEYNYNVSLGANLVTIKSNLDGSLLSFVYSNFNNSIIYDSSLSPKILDLQIIHLVSDLYMYRVYAKVPYGFLNIKIKSTSKNIGAEALVNGTLYEGTFEFILSSLNNPSFYLYDSYQNSILFSSGQYFSVNPLLLFQSPMIANFDITSIQNIKFLYNDIDVTYRRHYNVLYFSFTDPQVPKDYPIIMVPNNIIYMGSDNIFDNSFYSVYNETLQLYQIEFYVEANVPTGNFPFILYFTTTKLIFSSSLDTQLRISKSVVDLYGPIFKNIEKLNQQIYVNEINEFDEFGWIFTIEDSVNGFDSGYFILRGEMDLSIYNITISSSDVLPGGDMFLGDYELKLNISYPCISQSYVISQVVLYDRMNRVSRYSLLPSDSSDSVLNPFLNYLNDTNINKIQLKCQVHPNASLDTTPPELIYFDVTFVMTDTGGPRIQIQVIFQAIDLESGLKQDQFPILYLNTVNNDILECKSYILYSFPTGNTYSCSIYIPVGYGSGNPIVLSVYGFINNNGLFSGYSTDRLVDLGYRAIFPTQFQSCQNNIISSFKFTERDSDLWIFGRCFGDDSKVNIFNDIISVILVPSTLYSSAIKVSNLYAYFPTNQTFNVAVSQFGSTTNYITITPILVDIGYTQPQAPLPTNEPQKCLGNPICGGIDHGKCITNIGCLCYTPWIGNDCLSKIIIVDPPKINNNSDSSSPSIEITTPGNQNNNSSTDISYSSLISIVAIRELDILNKEVFRYTFKNDWISKQIDNLSYKFFNTISNNIKTNITVTLKWYTNETSILFANQQLIMNPSSMKYTIEIDSYPFKNKLNQLELIMSASISSNSSDNNICSIKEFGETSSGDNSNYIKIQINDHSLYGRFIKRGIVDNNIISIKNELLDKDMNSITTNNQLQSYIGIQIPNYRDLVIIDPDFSIVLDSYSASSKSGSICLNNSRLSIPKIVGIVIGSVAFIAVIIISISYHIIKKKNKKKFLKSVNQKMKQMD